MFCNGKKVGVKWAPPFEFNVTNYVVKGKNQFKIKVTNTWRNQLIFDASRPKHLKKTWTTNTPKGNNLKLEASGIIGDVKLRSID